MQTKQSAFGIVAAVALLSGAVAGAFAFSGSAAPAKVNPAAPPVTTVRMAAPNQAAAEKEDADDPNEKHEDKDEHEDGDDAHLTAAITPEQARAAALAVQPGTVGETELERENGKVVYSVDITAANGQKYEVTVDANTGNVLKSEIDNDDEADDD